MSTEKTLSFEELMELNKHRRFYQIAFLVEDLEGTMKKWVEQLRIGPWLIIEMNEMNCTRVIERGKPSTAPFRFFCATAMVGEIQIELIKPVFGVEAYERWLKKHGPGPHHIKEMVPDDRIDRVAEEFAERGMPITRAGHFFEDDHRYPETMEQLGFQYELGNCVPVTSLTEEMIRWYPPKTKKEAAK